MFKLFKSENSTGPNVVASSSPEPDRELLAHYLLTEKWSLELATGIFDLGPIARARHSIAEDERCGLLTLLRRYPAPDQPRVMELFEAASTEPAAFCFSTMSLHPDQGEQPITCVGETARFGSDGDGLISGIFVFPRVTVSVRGRPQ